MEDLLYVVVAFALSVVVIALLGIASLWLGSKLRQKRDAKLAATMRAAGFTAWHRPAPHETRWSKHIHAFELDDEGRGWLVNDEGERMRYDLPWSEPRYLETLDEDERGGH